MSNIILSFVIDADIARSSGVSEHPVSSGSRKLLENVANNGHKVAMCKNLRDEWKRHRSLFATKWLASMIARKRVIFIEPSQAIKNFINENIEDCRDKEIALKDSHLIDGALAVDKIVVSNDNTVKKIYCIFSEKIGVISEVSWFNAVSDAAFISEELMFGRYIPNVYYLRSENITSHGS